MPEQPEEVMGAMGGSNLSSGKFNAAPQIQSPAADLQYRNYISNIKPAGYLGGTLGIGPRTTQPPSFGFGNRVLSGAQNGSGHAKSVMGNAEEEEE